MTIKTLRQYRSIRIELERLEREQKSRELSDAVVGSDREFPYTQHKMSVSGLESDGDNMRLLERIHDLKRLKKEIEDFIYGIEDSLTRQIFELMYIEGRYKRDWKDVAIAIGGGNTVGAVMKRRSRELKKLKKNQKK